MNKTVETLLKAWCQENDAMMEYEEPCYYVVVREDSPFGAKETAITLWEEEDEGGSWLSALTNLSEFKEEHPVLEMMIDNAACVLSRIVLEENDGYMEWVIQATIPSEALNLYWIDMMLTEMAYQASLWESKLLTPKQ